VQQLEVDMGVLFDFLQHAGNGLLRTLAILNIMQSRRPPLEPRLADGLFFADFSRSKNFQKKGINAVVKRL
jgi:hypothetical protein